MNRESYRIFKLYEQYKKSLYILDCTIVFNVTALPIYTEIFAGVCTLNQVYQSQVHRNITQNQTVIRENHQVLGKNEKLKVYTL